MIFEIYNLRLANWIYVGLPNNLILRYAGYAWSFATIWPGIFVTAALLRAMDWFTTEDAEISKRGSPAEDSSALPAISMTLGALFLLVPPLLPPPIGAYLFGAVWLGPALLLEP